MAVKGVKFSEEHKRKLSEAKKGKPPPAGAGFQKGFKPWNKGIKGSIVHSDETKQKMSNSRKGKPVPWLDTSGEKNCNWKGGISKIDKLARLMPEYKQWRSNVFQRDLWTCQTCNEKGYVTAHHIEGFSKILKDNNIKTTEEARNCQRLWDINNGVTLCEPCHKLTDNYAGRGRTRGHAK